MSRENVCAVCRIEQLCCRQLKALKLSRAEYQTHFSAFAQNFAVQNHGNWYALTALKAQPCPHLLDNICSIYNDRPVECRLYPYRIHLIKQQGSHVLVTFNDRTRCPHKQFVAISSADARELAADFARNVFGDDVKVTVAHEISAFWWWRLLSRLGLKLLMAG